ncbi:MAG: hypothetical protein R2942_14250 [Ignavibacteria bacterium]
MNPVRTVIQNATRSGTDVLFTSWDGSMTMGFSRLTVFTSTE